MKLRTKLTAFSILLIGLAVFICCALILSFVQSGVRSDITETGLTDFQFFNQSLWQTLTNDLPESKIVRHSMLVNAFRAIDGFVEFSLKENGEILTSNVGFDVESLLGDDLQPSVGSLAEIEHKIILTPDGDYFIAHAILTVGTDRYDLSLARNITQRTNEIRELAVKCVLVGLVITALAAVAMWMLVFRAMHPIERLRKGAGELARGHYDKRIDIRGHNELAELAGDFNTMADAIEENVDSLRDRSVRQQAFINDLSHEMKTPITSILLNAETLLGRNVPPETMHRSLNRIFDQGKWLELLSQKLMTLVLLQERIDLRPERVTNLLQAVKETTIDALQEKGIALALDCDAGTLRMDFDLMRSALVNLVMNAMAASNSGQTIEIRAHSASIEVLDHGAGIPPDEIARITEPFYRVDRSRSKKHGGAGLGLALVKQIATAHGAQLVIESVVSRGTTVRIEFLPDSGG